MIKKIIILLTSLSFILAACAESSPPTIIDTSEPEAVSKPTATHEPTATSRPSIPAGEPMAGCRIIDRQPNPTLQAIFPSPGEADWIRGAKNATITLVEYSDFQ